MSVSTTVKKYGIEQAIKFMYKDPEKNLILQGVAPVAD